MPATNEELINTPHGVQENIKMDLLGLIQEGTDPYHILYTVAEYLETASAERGYAQHIIDNIRTIYGVALEQKQPLTDEIAAIDARREKIAAFLKSVADDADFSEDERQRLTFALKAHERKIARLKKILHKEGK